MSGSCALGGVAALLMLPSLACGDAGPPFFTNDPGTPGNGNWEINLGSMLTRSREADTYEVPQIDLNFGVGDRIQLTYEIPYVVQVDEGRSSGWGNAYPGVKWRFLDEGDSGWQLSTFPQWQTGVSSRAAEAGLGTPESRLLLPLEVARKVGPLALNFEAGYYTVHGPAERILGAVVGSDLSERTELDLELYDDRVPSHSDLTTVGVGGRYRLSPAFILLYLTGHSVHAAGAASPEFFGYIGIQILLTNGGRSLRSAEP